MKYLISALGFGLSAILIKCVGQGCPNSFTQILRVSLTLILFFIMLVSLFANLNENIAPFFSKQRSKLSFYPLSQK